MATMNKNSYLFSICSIFIAIASKVILHIFLPFKVGQDRYDILNLMQGNLEFKLQDSFVLTALFNRTINIFHFNTVLQWSIFYALIFNFVLIAFINRFNLNSLLSYFFTFASIGILNIYAFNLGKDVLQFCVILLVSLIISSRIILIKKLTLSVGILFLWGLIFRFYFMVIAAYITWTYLTYLLFKKNRWGRLSFLLVIIAGVFLSVVIAYIYSPNNYNILVNRRYDANFLREGNEDAITIINDVFQNNNSVFIYIINYLINLFRLMIPAELLPKGSPKYFLFFIYQIIITILYLKSLKKILYNHTTISECQILSFAIITGFIMGSVLFEPDFGSWIRHESTIAPVLLCLFFDDKTGSHVSDKLNSYKSRYIRMKA